MVWKSWIAPLASCYSPRPRPPEAAFGKRKSFHMIIVYSSTPQFMQDAAIKVVTSIHLLFLAMVGIPCAQWNPYPSLSPMVDWMHLSIQASHVRKFKSSNLHSTSNTAVFSVKNITWYRHPFSLWCKPLQLGGLECLKMVVLRTITYVIEIIRTEDSLEITR